MQRVCSWVLFHKVDWTGITRDQWIHCSSSSEKNSCLTPLAWSQPTNLISCSHTTCAGRNPEQMNGPASHAVPPKSFSLVRCRGMELIKSEHAVSGYAGVYRQQQSRWLAKIYDSNQKQVWKMNVQCSNIPVACGFSSTNLLRCILVSTSLLRR